MARCVATFCVVSVLLVGAVVTAHEGNVRAHWVTVASLQSADTIRRMAATAQINGYDTLFVPVRAHDGRFDPLAETIAVARARGLRVHAWINVNLVSAPDELPASRDSVVYQNPAWLMVPRELAPELFSVDARSPEYLGRLARWTRAHTERVDGLYVSPLHIGAQQQLAQQVTHLLDRYEVDGLHLDAVRFPGVDFDYSRSAIEAFRAYVNRQLTTAERPRMATIEAIDPFAYPEELPAEWRLFRQTQLTALVTRLRSTAKAVRPSVVVSATVTPDEARARETFQDWRTWLDNGFVDALCALVPGAEAPDASALLSELQALAGSRPVWVRD